MSNNPYQSPEQNNLGMGGPNYTSPDILSKVNAPAIGLMVYAGISALMGLINLIYCAAAVAGVNPIVNDQQRQLQQAQGQMPADQAEFINMMTKMTSAMNGPVGLVTNTIILLIAVGTFMAARKMQRLEGYTMAITFSILACVPCTSGCCILGLPIGIWAIVVLVNSEVKGAFRS